MTGLQNFLDEAHKFLTSQDTFAGVDNLQAPASGATTRLAITALDVLQSIHNAALIAETYQDPDLSPNAPLNGTQNRLTLNGLFEIIAVAGIQPYLSASVGIPFEKRVQLRVFRQGIPIGSDEGRSALFPVIKRLSDIVNGEHEGVKRFVRDRLLMDIVCGAAQLSYDSERYVDDNTLSHSALIFKLTLDKTPIHYVLPLLTSLVQNRPPSWFRSPLLEYLALVPLRRNGVRNIIDFVASAAPAAYDQGDESEQSGRRQGPSLTSESLSRAAHLLSSQPASLSPEEYFESLSEQLNSLLDGVSGPDMAQAAGYIIGTGILGKRDLGAPGKPGWNAFAAPLILSLNPKPSHANQQMSDRDDAQCRHPLVSQQTLSTTINRLSAIVQGTPSPGLTKRLIGPVFLSLWGLYNQCLSGNSNSAHTGLVLQLLRSYVSRCATSQQLSDLSTNLLRDGPTEWTFGAEGSTNVGICQRPVGQSTTKNVFRSVLFLDQRSKAFAEIVESTPDDVIVGEVFVDVARRWLMPMVGKPANKQVLEDDALDPFQELANAAIAKTMIERLQPRLVKSRIHIINLVKDILDNYLERKSQDQENIQSVKDAMYKGLQHIARSSNTTLERASTMSEDEQEENSNDDELASMALSLLNAFMTVKDAEDTAAVSVSLRSVIPTLTTLKESQLRIPASILQTAQNVLMVVHSLSEHSPSTSPAGKGHYTQSTPVGDRASYTQALKDLTSSSPAIRAEAISSITHLITSGSPVIDPQTTTTLLLNTGLRDEDEYVYLAGIQALVNLCIGHQTEVFRTLVNNYADREQERSLDERLRIGEAIAQILDSIANSQSEVATNRRTPRSRVEPATGAYLAEALIGISGRRGSRSKEAMRKRQDEKRADREARRAWGGDVPEIPSSLLGNAEDSNGEHNGHLFRILRGWEGSGEEEDVRMRASALSLLGKLFELDMGSLGQSTAGVALDSIKTLVRIETGPEKAMLRRAAVMLVMDVIKGLDNIYEGSTGQKEGSTSVADVVGVHGSSIDQVVDELKALKLSEDDQIVNDYIDAVLESVENWRTKVLLGVSKDGRTIRSNRGPDLAEGRLAGLDVDPNVSEGASTRSGLVQVIEED